MPVQSFENLSVTVPDQKGMRRYLPKVCQGESERREVQHNVSGKFPSKGLVAIMGPSGSGKTTFLNAVSNRMALGGSSGVQCFGRVKVDGEVVAPEYFYSKLVSYVPQDTCLFSEMTPKESIRFNTKLVYPHADENEIEERVKGTLTALSQNKCADTLIGNEIFRGVSGGERKRTSVGVAIVNDPDILFLDEPTTGLDTETGDMVIRSITGLNKKVGSQQDRIIIMTQHQPSSTTWSYISHQVLLVQGYIVYNGPSTDAVNFFVSAGFRRALNANPADYFLDIVQCQEEEDECDEASLAMLNGVKQRKNSMAMLESEQSFSAPKTQDKKARAKYLAGAWKYRERQQSRLASVGATIPEAVALPEITQQAAVVSTEPPMSAKKKKKLQLESMMQDFYKNQGAVDVDADEPVATPAEPEVNIVQKKESNAMDVWAGHTQMQRFMHELKVLLARSWLTFRRAKLQFPQKLMQVVITAILQVCLFSPFTHDQVSVLNRSGCMYLLIIIQIFASVLSVVLLFPEERGVYLSEQAARLYNVLPYFISKIIIDIPVLTLTIFCFCLLVYFPTGFQPEMFRFGKFFLVNEAVALAGHGLGLIVASVVASPSLAALAAPMAIAPFILFSRIAIPGDPNERIIWLMRPLQIFSPFFWALDALMATEFRDLRLGCTEKEVYAVPSRKYGILYLCRFERGEEVLASYEIDENNFPLSLFMLLLIATLCVVVSAILLKLLSKSVASSVPMGAPIKQKDHAAITQAPTPSVFSTN